MIYSGKQNHTVATCELCPWQEGQPLGARVDRMQAIIDGHMASAHPIDWSRRADRLAVERDQEWVDGLDERLSQVVAEYCGYVDGGEVTADGSASNDLAMERTEAVLKIAQEFRRSNLPEKLHLAAWWGIETLIYGAPRTVELRPIPEPSLITPDTSDEDFYRELEDALIKVPPVGPVRLVHFEQPGRVFTGTVTEDGEGMTFTAAPDPVMNHADQSAEPEPVMVTDQESEGIPPEKLGGYIVKTLEELRELLRDFAPMIDGPGMSGYRAVSTSDLDTIERLPTRIGLAIEAVTRLTRTPRRGV